MKQPLWILNSTLLFLLIAIICFIVFSRPTIPARESIEPDEPTRTIKKSIAKVNISKIYQADLFDTYKKEFPETQKSDYVVPFPEPPQPKEVSIPEIPKPQFLDPLNITLKGIIIISNDDTKNRAIIADNATTQESNYKVGDMLEDARLIRIFRNKISFLRSNGQQEVLYLREKDAKLDPTFATTTGWEKVIERITDFEYKINPQEFVHKVPNLAQFLDLLDLTTVYQQGSSFGCRIGLLEENSLGVALGLQKGDIVQLVNDIPATNNANRLKIYKTIITMKPQNSITVELQRDGESTTIRYTLEEFKSMHAPPTTAHDVHATKEYIERERLKMLEQKHRVAPTVSEIRKRERINMLRRGKPPLSNSLSNLTE